MSVQSSDTTGLEFGIILLGNTGVGKSFLGNVLLDRDVFQHECNPSSVTHVTEFRTFTLEGHSFAVFNIPGLIESDQTAIERNKQEIYKAFQQRPNSIVVFVFNGGSSGRIQNEDLVAFNAIHKVFAFKAESLLLIVNGLPVRRPLTYEGETQTRLGHLVNIQDVKVCFLDCINVENGDERNKLCLKMIDFILGQLKPQVHDKQGEIQLQADQIENLRKEAQKQQQEFERKISDFECTIADKDRQYKADQARWNQEYKNLQDIIARQKQEEYEKIRLLQERITYLENKSSEIVVAYANTKKRHWWKKIF